VAATKLASSTPRRAGRPWLGELRRAWLLAYAATWVLTLASAALLAINPPGLDGPVRRVLGATLDPKGNPPPSAGHVLVLLAHNLPLASWPLLLGVVGVHHRHFTRQAADRLVAAVVTINVLTVGAGLGVYGLPLLPYIPQVPLEWAALALGASAWLMQRRNPLTGRQGAALFAVIAGVLLCAAVLETVAVPHR
jgi:uncharacterized membrane protein SpoIIM required for sporulation